MRKSLKSAEVPHFWANQVQPSGYSGSIRFEGKRFYSYSTVVAVLLGEGDSMAVLTSTTYSPTTTRHMSGVYAAASHKDVVFVPRPDDSTASNFETVAMRVEGYLLSAAKARSNQRAWVNKAKREALDLNRFAELKGDIPPFDMSRLCNLDFKALVVAVKAETAQRLARTKARAAEDLEAHRLKLAEWLEGKSNYTPNCSEVHLRVKDDMIQTTKNAEIPVRAAKRLWPLIQAVRQGGKPWSCEERLGVYKLTKIDADGSIRVGCHYIGYDTLHTMAKALGLSTQQGEMK